MLLIELKVQCVIVKYIGFVCYSMLKDFTKETYLWEVAIFSSLITENGGVRWGFVTWN